MEDKSKSEWSMDDGMTYAKHCIIPDKEIGSEKWCEKLDEKSAGDWTADEATSYAKHCVVKLPKNSSE